MTDLLRVAEVAARECVRQGVGVDRLGRLLLAYDRARGIASIWGEPTADNLLGPSGLAVLIEPDNGGRVRQTPVSFPDGSHAIHPDNVERAFTHWLDARGRIDTEDWIREFLDIHPFVDGNGRTAWILRVWVLGQWDDPEPLPDYYGESTTGAPQARSIP